jgi:hypothetical protein
MSLIHTCQLCGANSFDYLTELQRHAQELATKPVEWMRGTIVKPWSGPSPSPIPRRVRTNHSWLETQFCDYATLPKTHGPLPRNGCCRVIQSHD